jgi:molybdopterin-guanine dinucleotide biosynthesis protein A
MEKHDIMGGIFVGGASTRMGGRPKGLLRAPDGQILVERWRALFAEVGLPCVLVGQRAEYAGIAAEALADDPPGIGPLGGLIALLARAGAGRAIAVACDMPRVDTALLRRLLEHPSEAAALAPCWGGRWEPLFARYHADRVLPIARARAKAGQRSLQGVLDALSADVLPLDGPERAQLIDWDAPHDIKEP